MPEPDTDLRPPLPDISQVGSEHEVLVDFLEYYRAVFIRKVEGLDESQVRVRVAPSSIDLLGLVRHMADVERWWFRGTYTAEVTSGHYESEDDPDLDWHHTPDDTLADALVHWHAEVARARDIVTATSDLGTLAALVSAHRGEVSLRWILIHMIEEYARHCGHADFLREAVDGVTGD